MPVWSPTVVRVGGCITPSIPKPWPKWRPQLGGLLWRPHRPSGRPAAADLFWFIYQQNLMRRNRDRRPEDDRSRALCPSGTEGGSVGGNLVLCLELLRRIRGSDQ